MKTKAEYKTLTDSELYAILVQSERYDVYAIAEALNRYGKMPFECFSTIEAAHAQAVEYVSCQLWDSAFTQALKDKQNEKRIKP